MNIFILITAHMFGDYVFQNDFLANVKSSNNFVLFVHCWLWASTVSYTLYKIHSFEPWKFVFLLLGHYYLDYLKCRQKDKSKALTMNLYIDQLLHLGQLLLVNGGIN